MRAKLSTFDELEWLPELETEWESYGGSSANESKLVSSSIRRGTTDENSLTDLVFFRRHPERNGRSISKNERNYQTLAQEWLRIRDTLVRPLLRTPNSRLPSTTPTSSAPMSGSVAARILDEARRRVGFHEGQNNDNPFSAYFNVPNVPWCAYFVSYVYTKGGIPLNIGSSDAMLDYLRTRGQFFSNTTMPQPADIVIFDWTRGDHDPAEHVGLVEKVYRSSSGQTHVGTIEGNSSDGVNRRDYPLGDARIVGFGRLAASAATAREFDELEWQPEFEDEWELEEEATFNFTSEVPASVKRLLPPSGQRNEQRERQAVAEAIRLRDWNENHLSDIVFFNRHPERNGAFIQRTERNFATISREWLSIRDSVVRPVLQSGTPTPPSTMPGPSTPSGLDLVALSWSRTHLSGGPPDCREGASAARSRSR